MDKSWHLSQRALVTAISLVVGTVAHAGIIRGNLDPPGANGIPPYNGFAIFDIPISCLDNGPGWYSTGGSSDCGGISMQSATIYLYPGGNGALPGTPQGNGATETVTFNTFQSPSNISGILLGASGQVLGIDSVIMGLGAESTGAFNPQDFRLQFVSGCNSDPVCSPFFGDFLLDVGPALTVADPRAILYDQINSSRTLPGGLTFTAVDAAVPEPGTVSLILGALGGGWLARRRKRQASG